MSDQQVSLPFLIILLLTIGVVTRYLFFSSSASGPRARNSRNNLGRDANAARLREVAAQRIQQMFPQVDRRTILWDLQRNGGSIQATTERILAGRMETVRDAHRFNLLLHGILPSAVVSSYLTHEGEKKLAR
jgi:coupling of ubiquitin conjugation to ER degradation protein 1